MVGDQDWDKFSGDPGVSLLRIGDLQGNLLKVKAGDHFTVWDVENPSTGYSWEVNISEPSLVQIHQSQFK